MSKSTACPVAIFDADTPPALAVVRSLGRAGVPVHVYSHNGRTVSDASRFVSVRRRCPSLLDARDFLPWLRAKIRSGEIRAIAPTSDLVTFYIAEVLDELPEEVRCLYPSRAQIHGVLFKDLFGEASTSRVRVPPALAPTSLEELRDRATEIEYPVVVKPRSHIGTPQERGFVAKSASQLLRCYAPLEIASGMKPLLKEYPHLALPIVQTFLKAPPEDLLTVSGLLDSDGNAVVVLGAKKTGQWPPEMGIGLLFEDADVSAAREPVVEFVRERVGRGIFELEVLPDGEGGYWALDLNPRAFGQIRFDIARGADLPLLWYSALDCCPAPIALPAGSPLRFAYTVPLMMKSAVDIAVAGAESGWGGMQAVVSKQVMDIVHDPDDVAPTAVFLRHVLRHPRALVWHFYRHARLSPKAGPR